MSLYKHIRDAWKKPQTNMPELWHERLLAWRKEQVTVRLERPTRIDRARSLGYKAKQGIIVVRQRIIRGGHRRPHLMGGRRPKTFSRRLNLAKNYQAVAEERVQKKFNNLVVLNSYEVAKDGKFYWFEVILVDPDHPVIRADKNLSWTAKGKNRGRAFHSQTSAGKRSRGLYR